MALGKLSFARLRPVHVAALTVAYWVGLAAVKLGGLLVAMARVGLPGMHGNIGAALKDFVGLHVTVSSSSGAVIWDGSTTLPVLLAWIAGPPLILAVTARWAREIETDDEPAESPSIHSGDTTRVLDAPGPDWRAGVERRSEVEAERRGKRE